MQKFWHIRRKLFLLSICSSFSLSGAGAYAATGVAIPQERVLLSPDVQTSLHTSIIDPMLPYLVGFKSTEKANAWLDDMANRALLKRLIPDINTRKRYLITIEYEASRAGLDSQLILSLITVESRFNQYAVSPTGARGIMQVMPFWLKLIGTPNQDLFDLQTNTRYGCTILRYYLQEEHGDMTRALARYNGSIGRDIYPAQVYQAYVNYWTPATVLTLKGGVLKAIDYTN